MLDLKVPVELPRDIDELYFALTDLPQFHHKESRKAFENYLRKLEQIKDFNSVKKYRVVFIGEPGMGKTTAICNWLNLLRQKKIGEKGWENIALLSTASGRTTVAEVHISQIETTSRMRLEYVPLERQRVYIQDYCEYYYNKINGITEEDFGDDKEPEPQVYIEIERVIRNMAGLESIPNENDERGILRRQRITDFMSQFSNLDEFTEYVIDKIDLPNRMLSEIEFTKEIKFEDWLRKQFRAVNDGNDKRTCITEKIFIEINRSDFDLKFPELVGEVVDTMGLDSNVRSDLQQLLTATDTICFLMDDVTSVPSSNIKNLLRQTFRMHDRQYCIAKTSIFVKSPLSALKAVNEADGDEDVGKQKKLAEIDRKIDSEKIQYNNRNTIFLDSCAAYHFDHEVRIVKDEKTGKSKRREISKIDRYNEDLAQLYREDINEWIEEMVDFLKKKLFDDAMIIRSEVEVLLEIEHEIVEKLALTEATNELVSVRMKLEKELNCQEGAFRSRFQGQIAIDQIVFEAISRVHWKTIQKMNSLFGAHNLWHTEIYEPIAQVGRDCFSDEVSPICRIIEDSMKDVRSKIARSMTESYISKMRSLEIELSELVGREFFIWSFEKKFAPQSMDLDFWRDVNAERGLGYRQRVAEKYRSFIAEDKLFLEQIVQYAVNQLVDTTINELPSQLIELDGVD